MQEKGKVKSYSLRFKLWVLMMGIGLGSKLRRGLVSVGGHQLGESTFSVAHRPSP